MNMAKSGSDNLTVHWRLEKWFPEVPKQSLETLKKYQDLILQANKSISLIGVKTIPFTDVIHFADSVIACGEVVKAYPKINHIYDFGSGNGFPGMVFAILYPNVKVTLVDLDAKKIEFLKGAATSLGLKNVDCIARSVESLPPGSVEYAISRDFAVISKAILNTRKIFKMGGVYFHMKGEEWVSEIANIPTQLCSIWSPSLVHEYRLPIGEIRFSLVKTVKVSDRES